MFTTTLAYTVDFRPDLHVVVLRWLRENTLAESQASYAETLAQARQNGCGRWLLDARRRGPIAVDVTNWLTDEFFPVAVAQLAPHRLHLAVLSSPARIEQMSADGVVAPHVARALAPERPYGIHLTTQEGVAVDWLCKQPS